MHINLNTASSTQQHMGSSIPQLGFGGGSATLKAGIREAAALGEAAFNLGIRLFDTAPMYGRGQSEMSFGQFLDNKDRTQFVLSTKVGCMIQEGEIHYDYRKQSFLESLDRSRERLRTDWFDIVYVHDINHRTHGAAFQKHYRTLLNNGLPSLLEQRDKGYIGAVGLAMREWDICREIIHESDIDHLMLAGTGTLLDQDPVTEFIPECANCGIGVTIAAPYNNGILATGTHINARYNFHPAPPEIRQRVDAIHAICNRFGIPLGAAALQFPLKQNGVKAVVAGVQRQQELMLNINWLKTRIPSKFWEELYNAGLLHIPIGE